MKIKDKFIKNMLMTTSDKIEMNKKMLKWRTSFKEVQKALNGDTKKK